jgi:uncharacterized protein (TIGR00661 family)
MIFVSFGNAPVEHSFTRLAEAIDRYAETISEECFVQSGNTRYRFKNCRYIDFITHDEMLEKMKQASIVILQGGWGTISEALLLHKRVVAVPRIEGLENYHDQSDLVKKLESIGYLIGVYEIEDLPEAIEKARSISFKYLQRADASGLINKTIKEWF